ncbi:MAG: transposase [Planctomycetaceae bacterium]|nr:transposase [Planctomycetaceae bacterium]
MRRYLRYRVEGGTYFFTLVTHERRPFLTTTIARRCLRASFLSVQRNRAFGIPAIVLLPDHLHCLLQLPRGDSDYSTRLRRIKSEFTKSWLAEGGDEGIRRASLRKKNERAVWQRRFYEHTVRDDEDLNRCADYIHWNPVKHRLVQRVRDYRWSSFHRFVTAGHYDIDWGATNPAPGFELPE